MTSRERVRLVRCGNHAIDQYGSTLRLVYRGGGVARTLMVVLAGVVLASASLGGASVGSELVVGLVMFGITLLSGVGIYGLVRLERSREAGPGVPLVVLDLDRQCLLAPGGEVIAPLSAVWTTRAFQVGSSSRALRLHWPGRSIIVARGNPFSATVDGFETILERHGVRRG